MFLPLILLFGTFCISSKRLALDMLFSLGLLGGVGTYDPVMENNEYLTVYF